MPRGDNPKSASSASYSYYKTNFHETSAFHYLLLALIIASLVLSTVALVYTVQFKKVLLPKTISMQDFLKKLIAHPDMKQYTGISPLNIIQINNNNFANLQAQISGLDISYIGSFIVQYTDRIVVYDYDKNQIRGSVALQQPQQLPPDRRRPCT